MKLLVIGATGGTGKEIVTQGIGARISRRRISAPARAATSAAGPLRVLVATHNLNFEGAPWFIFELARYFAAQPGVTVHIVSPEEGPMRRTFTEAGMTVEVADLGMTIGGKKLFSGSSA